MSPASGESDFRASAESIVDDGVEQHRTDHRWLDVLRRGLGHEPMPIEVRRHGRVLGTLPLVLVRSRLFGRFLVSLPYLNTAGVVAADCDIASELVDRAVELADALDVRYLELRHEVPCEHPCLNAVNTSKEHLRLRLPSDVEQLWKQFDAKVRNQVRKGDKQGLSVHWGSHDLLDEFYEVFARNMRDLGTPVYGRSLFTAILRTFPEQAELCVVRRKGTPLAAALLIHRQSKSEVPSAASLRRFSGTNANMWMYKHLLERAIERKSAVFDFGRSTADSNTFRFKTQWGAKPHPAVWQYYVRRGTIGDMRPENSRYGFAVRMWKRLPVSVTRVLGPFIVRGIP